ncbi:MAG: hypothetical protein ACLTSL_01280 [Odoribacter splanchnicus]
MKRLNYIGKIGLVFILPFFLNACGKSLSTSKVEKLYNNESKEPYYYIHLKVGEYWVENNSLERFGLDHARTDLVGYKGGGDSKVYLNGPCSGCWLCLNKYKDAGLIVLQVLEDRGDKKLVKVKLTQEGNKYAKPSVFENDMAVKFVNDKICDVHELNVSRNRAEVKVTWCWGDLSPFALALGLKEGVKQVYSAKEPERVRTGKIYLRYYEDKGWTIIH